MINKYKIFKCSYCDILNPCYCMIQHPNSDLDNDNIRNCLLKEENEKDNSVWHGIEIKDKELIELILQGKR